MDTFAWIRRFKMLLNLHIKDSFENFTNNGGKEVEQKKRYIRIGLCP